MPLVDTLRDAACSHMELLIGNGSTFEHSQQSDRPNNQSQLTTVSRICWGYHRINQCSGAHAGSADRPQEHLAMVVQLSTGSLRTLG